MLDSFPFSPTPYGKIIPPPTFERLHSGMRINQSEWHVDRKWGDNLPRYILLCSFERISCTEGNKRMILPHITSSIICFYCSSNNRINRKKRQRMWCGLQLKSFLWLIRTSDNSRPIHVKHWTCTEFGSIHVTSELMHMVFC